MKVLRLSSLILIKYSSDCITKCWKDMALHCMNNSVDHKIMVRIDEMFLKSSVM